MAAQNREYYVMQVSMSYSESTGVAISVKFVFHPLAFTRMVYGTDQERFTHPFLV